MLKHFSLVLFSSIVIIIAASLLFLYTRAGIYPRPRNLFPQYPLSVPKDWQTYSHPLYEVTFKHPSSLYVYERPGTNKISLTIWPETTYKPMAPNYLQMDITTKFDSKLRLLKPGQSTQITTMQSSQGPLIVANYTRLADLKIGGTPSYIFLIDNNKYLIYVPRRNYYYTISLHGQTYFEDFAQILSSFNFVDSHNSGQLGVYIDGGPRKDKCEGIQTAPCYPYADRPIEVVEYPNGRLITTIQTNSSGSFFLTLPAGEYQLRLPANSVGQLKSYSFFISPGSVTSVGGQVDYPTKL